MGIAFYLVVYLTSNIDIPKRLAVYSKHFSISAYPHENPDPTPKHLAEVLFIIPKVCRHFVRRD